MDPQVLAFQFQIGSFVVARNLAGIEHEESLLAPRPGGNAMNWIVGHIVRTRNQAIGLLGGKPLVDDAEFEHYGAGRFDPGCAERLEELRRRFDALGPAIAAALETATPKQLSERGPLVQRANPDETVGTLLASIAFHERTTSARLFCRVACSENLARFSRRARPVIKSKPSDGLRGSYPLAARKSGRH